jgi:hypothetical protein
METKLTRLLLSAAVVSGLAAIATGCMESSKDSNGGGSAAAPTPPPATGDDPTVVPASAGASGPAFVTYLKSLPADEVTTEPNTFAEGFTAPAEDGDEPLPAS